LADFADAAQRAGAGRGADASEVHRDMLTFVRGRADLVQSARPRESRRDQRAENRARTASFVSSLTVFASGCAPGIATVRAFELLEPDDTPTDWPSSLGELEALEDFQVQNQFTMLTPVRATLFRRVFFRFMLWFGNTLSAHWWNGGKLAGIGTIHFARIHSLLDDRYMLFMSDFDGSWRRYLGDFLAVGSLAVLPIWANLHGCPKTRFLLWPTPGFGQRFLRFTRTYQQPTQFWYSAYKTLTLDNTLRAARVRNGLFSAVTSDEKQAWLADL
jgi:hypothetical protein